MAANTLRLVVMLLLSKFISAWNDSDLSAFSTTEENLPEYRHNCNSSVVPARLDACAEAYDVDKTVKKMSNFINVKELHQFCGKKESLLECYQEAIGTCAYPFYDLQCYQTTFDILCDDEEYTIQAFDSCLEYLVVFPECIATYNNRVSVRSQAAPLTLQAECNIFKELRACLQILPSRCCPAQHANFISRVTRERFSPQLCTATGQLSSASPVGHVPSQSLLAASTVLVLGVIRGYMYCTSY